MAIESAKYLSTLHKQIDQYFSFSEVRTFCFDLGVDSENIPGDIRSAFIRNLLISLARQNRLQELIELARRERPFANWPDMPADFELPASMAQENIEQVVNYQVYGDYVGGDKITVGDITNAQAVAVGPGATAVYHQGLTTEEVAALVMKLTDRAKAKPPLPFEPELVFIPEGSFLMGDGDIALTAPQTTVELSAYAIGLYPVTNEQFAEFIQQTGRLASNDLLWEGNRPPRDKLGHPVIGVTWLEALAYCDWLRGLTERPYTLPSEAQWEKAARGVDGRLFPWGNEWEDGRCNTDVAAVTAVDAFPPQSPYGCFDMVGNAREWTTTLWGEAPREPDALYRNPWVSDGRRDNLNAPVTTRRIFRGGRSEGPAAYRCSARGHYAPNRSGPRQQRHGFRVILAS